MSKALLICLCIILSLLGSITGLTYFLSAAQAQVQESGFIVEDAEYVSTNTTAYSTDLVNTAENVTPRIVVEYGEFTSEEGLYKSEELYHAASTVSSRMIVKYADSIFEYDLQSVAAPDMASRIIVEYADTVSTNSLERPPAPLTSPPVTNVSLSGVLGRESWFTSNVEVNLSANVPVEKTEYSFDNTTWIIYTAPFTITNEGYTRIYYRSIDKAGNAEITKTETVKIDKTHPLGTILIDNGSIYTSSKTVTLTLNATDTISGISQMRFSNYGTEETWTTWEAYTTSKNWTITLDWELALQTKNVTVTVYVQYMDNADLVSTFSDTIILSINIPTPVVLNPPSNITASSVLLTWSMNDDLDFLCYQILWSLEPLEPSTGHVDDPHHFEQMVRTTIYDQSTVSYHVGGLGSSKTYYFVVRTFNEQGVYSDSNQVSATTHDSTVTPLLPWSLNTILIVFSAIVAISGIGFAIIRIYKSRRKPYPSPPYMPKSKKAKKKEDKTEIYGKPTSETPVSSFTLPSGEIRCGNCGCVNMPKSKRCRNCSNPL